MNAVLVIIFLSVLSAIVGVFSITELCSKSIAAGRSSDAMRANTTGARPSRQKIQQWVNQ